MTKSLSRRTRLAACVLPMFALLAAPLACLAQSPDDALDWQGKLRFQAAKAGSPLAIAGIAAYAGVIQELNSPQEWGQGAAAYGKRVASTAAAWGIHNTIAFGLDSALHQDPRYFRSHSTNFWRRAGHALRGTILTRTDSGGETLSTWRLGSDYGAAFLSNLWYPARLDTVRLGFLQGSMSFGFDAIGNLGAEFWPDIKRKIFRRKG